MPRPNRRVVTIAAGATWPDQEGRIYIPPFTWLHVQNRGAIGSGNDLTVSILGPAQGEKPDTIVRAGTYVLQNIGGVHDPPATSLHITNTGAAAVDVFIQTADSPIIFYIGLN